MENSIGIWVEQYRPKTFDEIIGQDDIKNKLKEFIKEDEIPNILFFGRAGVGKTSAINILLKNLDCESLIINASDDRGIDVMRERITDFASRKSFYKWKIIVLEESDNITGEAAKAFKMILEQYYKTTRFILTTNHIDRLYEPILSRLQKFEFKPQSIDAVIERCKHILNTEKIEYDKKDLQSIVKTSFPDMRAIINHLQRYTIDKKLTLTKEHALQEKYREIIVALLKNPCNDSLNKARILISKLYSIDYLELFRYLFDFVEIYASDVKYIADLLITIEEHMYRSKDTLDKQMNFMSCLIKIMQINNGGRHLR